MYVFTGVYMSIIVIDFSMCMRMHVYVCVHIGTETDLCRND